MASEPESFVSRNAWAPIASDPVSGKTSSVRLVPANAPGSMFATLCGTVSEPESPVSMNAPQAMLVRFGGRVSVPVSPESLNALSSIEIRFDAFEKSMPVTFACSKKASPPMLTTL